MSINGKGVNKNGLVLVRSYYSCISNYRMAFKKEVGLISNFEFNMEVIE